MIADVTEHSVLCDQRRFLACLSQSGRDMHLKCCEYQQVTRFAIYLYINQTAIVHSPLSLVECCYKQLLALYIYIYICPSMANHGSDS